MQANIKFKEEDIISNLTSIYQLNGYSTFKMNKFEEYDLYSKNKDFLISEEVITFTDTNGKLMALKPDVTLSIIKNNNANGSLIRLFYNENVYRVSKGTSSFKEIMQSGIECIGDIRKKPRDSDMSIGSLNKALSKYGYAVEAFGNPREYRIEGVENA